MKRIDPEALVGPRSFFTNFDHRIISASNNEELLKKDIERTIKILLLVKTNVVCAASHLTTEFTYEFFKEHPLLLQKNLVIPALREDKNEFSELFNEQSNKDIPKIKKKAIINFFEDNIDTTISWKITDNSPWFRENFIKELNDSDSVLRSNLVGLSENHIANMIYEIEKDDILGRDKIDSIISNLEPAHKVTIKNFRELTYHILGAKSVNCESSLPQENYLDYSLADINNRKILLSDTNIFWKLFLELAFETIHKVSFPLENLDILSFDDIYNIRAPILSSDFQKDYDALINKCIESIKSREQVKILYNIEELLSIRARITKNFTNIFDKELPILLKKKKAHDAKILGKNTLSISLGALGFVPFLSTVANVAGILLSSPSFVMNIWQKFMNKSAYEDYNSYLKMKEALLKSMIEQSEITDRTTLLDVVDLLMSVISKKMTL